MKPTTTIDILELMNGHIYSAILGTAMEYRLDDAGSAKKSEPGYT